MTAPLPLVTMPGYVPADTMYSDGTVEDELLELFQQDDAAVAIQMDALLCQQVAWPILYHLSPQRWHLLDWFPFPAHGRLLEIGAGCGAMTGLFAQHVAHVDALEISERRSQIMAHRHRALTNVTVLLGDLVTLPSDKRYDVIVIIGVLEYAGKYHSPNEDATNPYVAFLNDVRRHLHPDGQILIAIENQIGLKYLAGFNEDHYGCPFIGIEDYVADMGVRTFGKAELAEHIVQAGFQVQQWYYPFPDYKLPTSIYSDALPPGSVDHLSLMYPTIDHSHIALPYFAEHRLAQVLQRNHILDYFSNSFLTVCSVL